MNTPNNGRPAFPEPHYFDPSRGQYGMHMTASDVGCGGMSLRDWFAGQALAAKIAINEAWNDDRRRAGSSTRITTEETARACYVIADAMLAAREAK